MIFFPNSLAVSKEKRNFANVNYMKRLNLGEFDDGTDISYD